MSDIITLFVLDGFEFNPESIADVGKVQSVICGLYDFVHQYENCILQLKRVILENDIITSSHFDVSIAGFRLGMNRLLLNSISEEFEPQEPQCQQTADNNLIQSAHKACDFSKYDCLFDTKGTKAPREDYLGVVDPRFMADGVWPTLLHHLYMNGYLSLTDIPRFVYRMTGKKVGSFQLLMPIDWLKDERDLYFICKALYGPQMPASTIKQFFNFKDESKFRPGLGVTQDLRNLFSVTFKYEETHDKKKE